MVLTRHGVLGGPRPKKKAAPKTKEVIKEEVIVRVVSIEEISIEEIDPILEEDKDFSFEQELSLLHKKTKKTKSIRSSK
jgi:hypothetical protein